jgi:ABC-type nitrate/sulfonate/bicarbonate transport system permease component
MAAIAMTDIGERKRVNAKRRDRLISVASPVGLLVAWELAAQLHFIDTRFFPAPSSIVRALIVTARTGELWENTTISLQRMVFGFLLGGVPALVLGIVMGISRPIRAFVDPLIAATYPIPKSSILPLILLIFGLGEMSKVVMVAIGVFYPIAINSTAGVLQINKVYLDVGKSFKAGRWETFRTIALPGALPFIMTGVKLGAGLGLILIAIAEMVGAKSGIGYMIWSAWETFSVERMYVGLFVIAIIGFVMTLGLNELERWLIPWKAEP